MTGKKIRRVFVWLCILAFLQVCVLNIRWVEFRILGETHVAFMFSPAMGAVYLVILLCAAFKEELEKLVYRADGYLLGDLSLKPLASFHARYDLIFWVLCIVFGLLFVIAVPPMYAPDETNHFARAYMLAHGNILPTVESGRAVGYVSRDFTDFLASWNSQTWKAGSKLPFSTLNDLFTTAASSTDNAVAVDFPYPYLSFFMYIPQAIGILIGRLFFHLFGAESYYNIYVQLLFARLANLTAYLIVIFIAIRIIPVYKRTLAILTLMPMSVFIASSCSYDVYMYTVCILYTALVLRYTFDPDVKAIGGRRRAALIVLGFLILVGKYVYFPLLFLVYVIPREKLGDKSKRHTFFTTILPCIGLLAIWLLIYHHSITGIAQDVYSQAYTEQALFVLMHPVKYMAILVSNLNIYSKSWVTGFVGLFGWLNVPMPLGFVTFYIVLLLASAAFETVINQSCLPRWLLGAVGVLCYVLVATAEYVVWTPGLGRGHVGQYTIIGVQGRYFIPFALPLLLLLVNNLPYRTYLFGKIDLLFHRLMPFALAGTLVYAFVFLLQTYWAL